MGRCYQYLCDSHNRQGLQLVSRSLRQETEETSIGFRSILARQVGGAHIASEEIFDGVLDVILDGISVSGTGARALTKGTVYRISDVDRAVIRQSDIDRVIVRQSGCA